MFRLGKKSDPEAYVTLYWDGTVEYGKHYTPTDAAEDFWHMVYKEGIKKIDESSKATS